MGGVLVLDFQTDIPRMQTVLWVLMETLRHVAVCSLPLMPESAERMLDQLTVPAEDRTFASLTPEKQVVAGSSVTKPVGIFPRIDVEEREAVKA